MKLHTKYLLILIFLFTSCRVMLIGAYDEVTDQSIQQIQTDVSSLLVSIEKNLFTGDTSTINYSNYKSTYDNIEGQLQSVLIRSEALPKYKLVSDEIRAFDSTIHRLEGFHKLGFTQSDTSSIRIIEETIELDFRNMIVLQNGLKRRSGDE